VLSRWFDKKPESGSSAPASGPPGPRSGPKSLRHSGGWAELRKRFQADEGLRVLDVGYTSPANINFLTGMGHSIFLADMVDDACTGSWQTGLDEGGNPVWDIEGFLAQSLNFSSRMFDVVLLWSTLDYLPEALVAPVVARLFDAMNPGGQVLAYFHTRSQGEQTEYYRYLVTDSDEIEMRPAPPFPIQRAFTNRSIEHLFAAWSGYRQFLAKDSISELIITR
jgi:hypothetical protein